MSEVIDLFERAGRVTTTEDALAIIAEWERHVVETGKSPEEARAIVESNLGYLRQYLTEDEADRFFALASGEEYTPRIDEVSQLKARVAELEAQNAELLDTIRASRDDMKALPDIVEPGQTRLWTETVNSVWENLDGVLNDAKFQKPPAILGERDTLRKAVRELQYELKVEKEAQRAEAHLFAMWSDGYSTAERVARKQFIPVVRELLEIARLAQAYAPGELGEFPERVQSTIDKTDALLMKLINDDEPTVIHD